MTTTTRKRHAWIRREIDAAARTVTFTAMRMNADGEGEIDPTIGQLVFHADRASTANNAYAALHGFNQRIGDAAALDAGASMADKFAAMRTLVDHYETGSDDWDLPRVTRAKRELTDDEKRALLAKLAAELGATVTL